MKLYCLINRKSKNYYRMTKVFESDDGKVYYDVIWTGVQKRAAFFLDKSTAEDVALDLMSIEKNYEVVEYETV